MTKEQLENMFFAEGYCKVPSNLPELTFYFRKENQGVNVVCTVDFSSGLYITEEQYVHMKGSIRDFFIQRGEQEIHILTLILCTEMEKARALCHEDRFCWIVDVISDRLVIYEGQVADFYGMKAILENFLYTLQQEPAADIDRREADRAGKRGIRELPWINIALVAVNVILFLICTFTGDLLYNIGAFSVQDIIERGDFYRMLTSMFLHADIEHLTSNMLVLYYVGEVVEKRIGHLPYAVIYILSGLAGDVLSMAYELLSGQYISSVGASGAVFGIEGALLMLVLLHRGKIEYMTAGRVVFAIAFSLYCGFTSAFVNNAAHIGGVMMGFAAMGILWICSARVRGKGQRNEG